MATKISSFKLDEAFSQLEEIVKEFESGAISLEDSIKKFEEGLFLANYLKKRLKQVENKIVEIQTQFESEE